MRKLAWYCKDEKTFNELIQKLTDAGFRTNMGASPQTIHFNDDYEILGNKIHNHTDMLFSHGFDFAPLLTTGTHEKYKKGLIEHPDWYKGYQAVEFKHGDTVPDPFGEDE